MKISRNNQFTYRGGKMSDINLGYNNKEIDFNKKENIINKQDNALSGILNNVINWSIDAGLRYILPDSIENEVIKIKNDFINGNTAQKIIDNIKEVINFNKENKIQKEILNINEIKDFLKNPNTLKFLANTVDEILIKNFQEKDIKIEKNNTKKIITENIENKLNDEIESQIKSFNKIENYKNEWYKNYENKDLEKMNKTLKKINKEFKKIIPIENTIKEIRKIENLNELINSKGGDFNVTKEERELANRLI